ncbi:MAG: efflux RND transporter periplasmic adaptor subunit [Anaerolineales bacterium]|nr:efflux RND transporter periplasmic adaptor subunit [Anaerolineales bacterium]
MNRRWIWVLAAVIIVGTGVFLLVRGRNNDTAAAQEATSDVVTAFIGDLSASASASGQVIPQREATLPLARSGQVMQVNVEVGDVVNEGDVLVELERTALERAVSNAEQSLTIQESNLAKLLAPPNETDLVVAEAAVASAQARLDNLLNGPTEAQIAASASNLRAAEANVAAASARLSQAQSGGTPDQVIAAQNALDAAQEAYTTAEERHRATYDCDYNESTGTYDCEGGSAAEEAARVQAQQALADLRAAEERLNNLQPGGNTTSVASGQASLAQAVAQRDAAQARHDLLLAGATDAQIAEAEAGLAQAQAQLDALTEGASDEQITITEAAVEQARLALELAQNNLADASLIAPFGGVITAVYVSEGEFANGIAIALIDTNSLEVVLDVDEIDIGSVEIGQEAIVTIESFPDSELSSEVVAIAPKNKANTGTGLVTYEVNLSLPETDLPILANMTANAQLVTANREDVLLVPNRAITADREAGTYAVQLIQGEEVVEQTITIGLRDGQYTQVTSGLNEGDQILIGDIDAPRIEFGPGNEQ